MACFIIPAVEAAAVTIMRKTAEKKNKNTLSVTTVNPESELANTLLYKTRWLTNLLWGGSLMLAFEHIWHGEIVPWFPFLTAMRDSDAASDMLHEMATNGVGMALLSTIAWGGMVFISHILTHRNSPEKEVVEHV